MPFDSLAQVAGAAYPTYEDYLRDIQNIQHRQLYEDLIAQDASVRNPHTGDVEYLPMLGEGGAEVAPFDLIDLVGLANIPLRAGAKLAARGIRGAANSLRDAAVDSVNRGADEALATLDDIMVDRAPQYIGVTDLGGVGRRASFPSWYYGSKDAMTPDDLYYYKTFVMPAMGRYPKNAAGERAYNKAVDYYLGMDGWDAAENPISRAIIQHTARQNVFDPVVGRYVSQVDIPNQGKKMLDAMDAVDGRATKRNWYADKLRDMMFDETGNAAENVAGPDTLNTLARWAQYANNPNQDLWNRGRPIFDWVDAITYGDLWR